MPYMAMVFLQFGFAGLFLISVASLRQGMSHYVLVVYRNAVAAVVMAPFALWFERLTHASLLDRSIQFYICSIDNYMCVYST